MPTFLITGTPGTGKSSVCKALLQAFPSGLHLPVDDFREFVVSGIAHPVPEWTPETSRQFLLARQAVGKVAMLYHLVGFAVAIDDVLGPQDTAAFDLHLVPHKILLRAELEVVLERNRTRQNKHFDPQILEGVIQDLHRIQEVEAYQQHGWLVLDTTELDVSQTVQAILHATGYTE